MIDVVGSERLSEKQMTDRLNELRGSYEEAVGELEEAQSRVARLQGQITEAQVWVNTIRKAQEEINGQDNEAES